MMRRFMIYCLLFLMVFHLTGCQNFEEPMTQPTETTEAPTQPTSDYQKSDPSEDDTLNLLMIGNSGCYYYVEELYGLAKAAGIKMRVCNVYYSGCTLSQHWNWWVAKEANYDYYTTDENGRVKAEGKVDLEWCLQQQNWDFISLQEGGNAAFRTGTTKTLFAARQMYLNDLLGYLKKQFPMSTLLWQQNSAYQIGYNKSFSVTSLEDQENDTQVFRDFAIAVQEKYGIDWIPRGDAALRMRQGGYDKLCARLGYGTNHEGDYYHDGDVGGGQYLTACVWLEVLTGRSCIGNSYRPVYTYKEEIFTLDEDLITKLQQAAHDAVEDLK